MKGINGIPVAGGLAWLPALHHLSQVGLMGTAAWCP